MPPRRKSRASRNSPAHRASPKRRASRKSPAHRASPKRRTPRTFKGVEARRYRGAATLDEKKHMLYRLAIVKHRLNELQRSYENSNAHLQEAFEASRENFEKATTALKVASGEFNDETSEAFERALVLFAGSVDMCYLAVNPSMRLEDVFSSEEISQLFPTEEQQPRDFSTDELLSQIGFTQEDLRQLRTAPPTG